MILPKKQIIRLQIVFLCNLFINITNPSYENRQFISYPVFLKKRPLIYNYIIPNLRGQPNGKIRNAVSISIEII